jgi:mRNA interferase HicA
LTGKRRHRTFLFELRFGPATYLNTRAFIKRVREIGSVNGVAIAFDPRKGKGSHGRLTYGDRVTTVPSRDDIRIGLLRAMVRDLGLEDEFRGEADALCL